MKRSTRLQTTDKELRMSLENMILPQAILAAIEQAATPTMQ
ncbi:hypothetical protein [Pseudomonas sp. MWU16-30317]|nr:hypothetical protein [Pseudomonas sp. MWU16-30317]